MCDMGWLIDIVLTTWLVAAQMAPYLLLGFLVAGVLSVFVSPEFIEQHLGRRTIWQVCKAALLGVPLPLCSCGVIPVATSLHRHGASRGATLSFLVSTPQTGVDSIMVTHALLGPVFAVFRVVTAFVSGILSGTLVQLLVPDDPDERESSESCPHCASHKEGHGKLHRLLHYGFVVLARDIGRAMIVGIVVSGVLTTLVPENYLADRLGPGPVSMLVMVIIGIPLYVCSSGSVPIAFALIRMGLSPGAALVFLVTGPATNAAALTAIWDVLGKRSAIIYLASIIVCAVGAGMMIDMLAPAATGVDEVAMHSETTGWMNHLWATLLVIVLLPSLWHRKRNRPRQPDVDSAPE